MFVFAQSVWVGFAFRYSCSFDLPVVVGNPEDRLVWGHLLSYRRLQVCLLRQACKVPHSRSARSSSMLRSFVAPVIILAALMRMVSNCLFGSVWALPQTKSQYYSRGHIDEFYSCIGAFLILNFRPFNRFNLALLLICSAQGQELEI